MLNHYNASGRGTGTNVPPIASFTSTVTGATVKFDASASTDIDGTITGYAWDFGDGSPAGSGKTPSHIYTNSGTYPVKLTVTDNKGATTSTTNNVAVTVPNSPPTASFSYTTNVGTVNVDGSGSSDTDGTVKTWAWDFGDGSTGTGEMTSHDYTKTGTYAVKLTVTDDKGGTNSQTQNVTVTLPNVPPTAAFSYTKNGTTVNVDGSGSTDSDGTVTGYAWDFGEPSSGTNTASGKTASHQYAAPGTYTVSLTVTDDQNATSTTTTQDVTVSAVTYIANDTFNRMVTNGWGAADVGGAWTIATGQAAKFAVAPGAPAPSCCRPARPNVRSSVRSPRPRRRPRRSSPSTRCPPAPARVTASTSASSDVVWAPTSTSPG